MTLPAPGRRAINADLKRWGRWNRAQVIAWLKRNRGCFARAFRAGASVGMARIQRQVASRRHGNPSAVLP